MKTKYLKTMMMNLAFTHKVHEKESYLSKLAVTSLRILSIGLLGGALTLVYFDKDNGYAEVSALLTVVSVLLQVFQLSFGFENKHESHRNAAKSALRLRDKLGLFIDDIDKKTEIQRDILTDEIGQFYKAAPQTGIISKSLADSKRKKG